MITITEELFRRAKSGRNVYKFIIGNDNKMNVCVLNYGGYIQSIAVPDMNGRPTDVVLGYDTVEEYETRSGSLGAFVGRYANRIGGAQFTLDGNVYQLTKNSLGKNHIHGLLAKQVFDYEILDDGVLFRGMNADGEEGFPGTLSFSVSYRLTENNKLLIGYRAVTDKATVINFTNHSYFNLNGQDGSTVSDHILELKSSYFTECNAETLPTGRILSVEGSPLDFTSPKKIGRDIGSDYEQMKLCRGYDHNFILDERGENDEYAVLRSEKTGIEMHCFTDQPAVQLYSANYLDNEPGKNNVRYPKHGGICLETQHYPDSPNHPDFPSTVLRVGEEYRSETVYQFLTK